jgi:predicted nucleotidyltransferase
MSSRYGVADALFTSTQQKVLAILFGQPDRSFFATELISLAGAGSGAVQRELTRLSESGLLTVRKIGSQKHFQANRDSPIFNEVRQIVSKTFGLATPLKEALQAIEDVICLAVIFGSVASKTDTAQSDIDLMVVSDKLTLEDLFKALEPAEQHFRRQINPLLLTIDEFDRRKKEKDSFVNRVLNGEIIVLIGRVDEQNQAR